MTVEFLALCDLAEVALHAVESAGHGIDDRPELALATVRRWADGGASLDEVEEAAEAATDAWSLAFDTPAATAYGAVDWLCLGAQDDLNAVDAELRDKVFENVRDTLVALGEAPEAASARVSETLQTRLAVRRVALAQTDRRAGLRLVRRGDWS